MNDQEFFDSLKLNKCPDKLSPYLQALWYDAAGDWNTAHEIVQQMDDARAARIHAYLHRKYEPFRNPRLTSLEVDDDAGRVFVEYDTEVGVGKLYSRFVPRESADTNHMRLCYEYPHQWSNTDDWIKHWCLVLPIDERTTRAFFLFYYKQLKIPLLPVAIPRRLMVPILKIANRALMRPLLEEDGVAVEAEQEGYERHYDAPVAELNPAVLEFQKLTIAKWEQYLSEREGQPKARRASCRLASSVGTESSSASTPFGNTRMCAAGTS